MSNFLEKIIGDFEGKKEWKAMKIRAKALPKDYQIVYEEIQKYIWKTSSDGSFALLKNLLDMFEEGAINGRKVLELTGTDVGAFADELMRDEKSYLKKMRQELNKEVLKKLGKETEGK